MPFGRKKKQEQFVIKARDTDELINILKNTKKIKNKELRERLQSEDFPILKPGCMVDLKLLEQKVKDKDKRANFHYYVSGKVKHLKRPKMTYDVEIQRPYTRKKKLKSKKCGTNCNNKLRRYEDEYDDFPCACCECGDAELPYYEYFYNTNNSLPKRVRNAATNSCYNCTKTIKDTSCGFKCKYVDGSCNCDQNLVDTACSCMTQQLVDTSCSFLYPIPQSKSAQFESDCAKCYNKELRESKDVQCNNECMECKNLQKIIPPNVMDASCSFHLPISQINESKDIQCNIKCLDCKNFRTSMGEVSNSRCCNKECRRLCGQCINKEIVSSNLVKNIPKRCEECRQRQCKDVRMFNSANMMKNVKKSFAPAYQLRNKNMNEESSIYVPSYTQKQSSSFSSNGRSSYVPSYTQKQPLSVSSDVKPSSSVSFNDRPSYAPSYTQKQPSSGSSSVRSSYDPSYIQQQPSNVRSSYDNDRNYSSSYTQNGSNDEQLVHIYEQNDNEATPSEDVKSYDFLHTQKLSLDNSSIKKFVPTLEKINEGALSQEYQMDSNDRRYEPGFQQIKSDPQENQQGIRTSMLQSSIEDKKNSFNFNSQENQQVIKTSIHQSSIKDDRNSVNSTILREYHGYLTTRGIPAYKFVSKANPQTFKNEPSIPYQNKENVNNSTKLTGFNNRTLRGIPAYKFVSKKNPQQLKDLASISRYQNGENVCKECSNRQNFVKSNIPTYKFVSKETQQKFQNKSSMSRYQNGENVCKECSRQTSSGNPAYKFVSKENSQQLKSGIAIPCQNNSTKLTSNDIPAYQNAGDNQSNLGKLAKYNQHSFKGIPAFKFVERNKNVAIPITQQNTTDFNNNSMKLRQGIPAFKILSQGNKQSVSSNRSMYSQQSTSNGIPAYEYVRQEYKNVGSDLLSQNTQGSINSSILTEHVSQ